MKWVSLMAVLSLAVLPGARLPAQEADAAGGGAQNAAPLYTGEDLLFLRHMSIHHQQAVDMSALVASRTEREAFIRFARYVARAQAAEIESMEALLDLARERGLEIPEHPPHGDPPMAGMLSAAQMEDLENASGARFERLWIEGMIFHHEGGLAMARAQQLQQLKYGRRPYGFHALVEDILVEQRAEIIRMRGWLEEWGLAGDEAGADTRAPAAAVTSPPPGAAVSRAPLTLIGTAIDDSDIAAVRVGIQDMNTGRWWRGGDTWGEYQGLEARITRSGPSSMAWRFEWTPPDAGHYGIRVSAEDPAGNTADSRRLRTFSVE